MDIKVQVPNHLSEINLAQYTKYLNLAKANASDPNAETFVSLKMLEIFCNVPYEASKDLKFKDVSHIIGIIADMLNSSPPLVTRFKLGDTEFGFIPKLDDISFGEYIDLDNFISDWDNMHKAMAVLYRPVVQSYGERYRIAEYEPDRYTEAMKNMPMDAVISSLVFFYNLGIELSIAMRNYLTQTEEEALRQSIPSDVNGAGINQFTDSLKAMLQDSMILPPKDSTNA